MVDLVSPPLSLFLDDIISLSLEAFIKRANKFLAIQIAFLGISSFPFLFLTTPLVLHYYLSPPFHPSAVETGVHSRTLFAR